MHLPSLVLTQRCRLVHGCCFNSLSLIQARSHELATSSPRENVKSHVQTIKTVTNGNVHRWRHPGKTSLCMAPRLITIITTDCELVIEVVGRMVYRGGEVPGL